MVLFAPDWAIILFTVLSLLLIVLWAVALWDVVGSQFANANDKLVWVLVVLFAPVLGMLFYFLAGRKNKINQ
ncbi:PLD nuclease N-terminal domain-containing protein [Pseudocnuella soli]|uniref:PLD nuclease N-terminal domain-containing protein n=1 Tax=Pseudocnuella soli TaxID=2502779 RepID=UPI00104A2328|nr:PLD nuclease N-terminal domain-containing protein [Pseudocnuella soli]